MPNPYLSPFVFELQTVTGESMLHSKHNDVYVPAAYGYQSIHAPNIVAFVLQLHKVTRASMPKPLCIVSMLNAPQSTVWTWDATGKSTFSPSIQKVWAWQFMGGSLHYSQRPARSMGLV